MATAPGRKVAILGDMFELGENEKAMHGEVGEYAAEKGIDLILCVMEQQAKNIKKREIIFQNLKEIIPTTNISPCQVKICTGLRNLKNGGAWNTCLELLIYNDTSTVHFRCRIFCKESICVRASSNRT